ncbi:hypothetical protein A7P53_10290 [Acinetobacter defluvii]|uniref:hypothetical protein n=1 Tax=Acinetobacter defluvii TaxID=1871111 RepID=UPI00148F7DC6|nr:hypothetical protein [Acinetobacter defluvii]NNP72958.1 hypothetical protein [Acinetobacter defluvii]
MRNKVQFLKQNSYYLIISIICIFLIFNFFYTDKIWLNIAPISSKTQTTCLSFKNESDIKEFTYSYIRYYLGEDVYKKQKRLSIENTQQSIKVYGHTMPVVSSWFGMGGGGIEMNFIHQAKCYSLLNISIAK